MKGFIEGALLAAGVFFLAIGVCQAVTFLMDHIGVCVK
jgi:hypothetical protein